MQEETKPFEVETVPASAMIAVVGRTNVGKSTLVNRLLGEKVSIVSAAVQTTRNVIRGILTEPRGQLVFLDTPGIHQPFHDLGKQMNSQARSAVSGVDMVLPIFDTSQRPSAEDEGWIRRLLFEDIPVLAVLNKTDTGGKYREDYLSMWTTVAEEKESAKTAEWLSLSAETGEGCDALLSRLFDLAPPGPYLFPPDVLTDFPRNLNLSDLIREAFIPHLRDEVPHALAVGIDSIEEGDAERWHIQATVYVDRPSQKGIVLGQKGRLIKKVEREAAKAIGSMYERPVSLRLWVKVEKNWTKNHFLLKRLGYRD